MAALRQQRQREMVRIAWRDLAGSAPVADILAETSAFADAAIAVAVDFAARELGQTYGTPRSAAGEPQPLIVLGMGKLGGGELEFLLRYRPHLCLPREGRDPRRAQHRQRRFLHAARPPGDPHPGRAHQ